MSTNDPHQAARHLAWATQARRRALEANAATPYEHEDYVAASEGMRAQVWLAIDEAAAPLATDSVLRTIEDEVQTRILEDDMTPIEAFRDLARELEAVSDALYDAAAFAGSYLTEEAAR